VQEFNKTHSAYSNVLNNQNYFAQGMGNKSGPNERKQFGTGRDYYIILKFNNGTKVNYIQDTIDENILRACPYDFIKQKKGFRKLAFYLCFSELFELEQYIKDLKMSKERFKKVEEFLMNKHYEWDSIIHPGKILKYFKIINTEGTFLFFRRNNLSSEEKNVAPGQNSNFLLYPQVRRYHSYWKEGLALAIPCFIPIKDWDFVSPKLAMEKEMLMMNQGSGIVNQTIQHK
jgi:hypothetical protein